MVVVKIELWPGGDESTAREIGRAFIANDGSGSMSLGNYTVKLVHAGKYYGRPGVWKTGRLSKYLRSLSPYHLVMMAFGATLLTKGATK